uniref:RecA family profile 1 domain-containing protein n=1 Tax=Glossina austeni TaxID=7395 RepID=A0A1A9VKS1_GLOAU
MRAAFKRHISHPRTRLWHNGNLLFIAYINDAQQAMLTPQAHLLLKDFTEEDIHALKTAAATLLAKPTVTAYELSNLPHSKRYSRVSFACTALDKCTRGGILTRGITEFCGSASAGKAQLLLHLCLTLHLNDE